MIPAFELRRRARASLGMNVFGSLWLLSVLATIIASAMLSAASYVVVGVLILMGPVSVGLATVRLRLARGEGQVDLGNLFVGFTQDFTGNLLIGLVVTLKTFLWSLLFIVPGIIASYRYALAPYLMAENPDMGVMEAIARSKELMNGSKWRLFCLQLSFIGWNLLCVLTLGIGYLWLTPYQNAAEAAFYLEVTGRADAMPRPDLTADAE